VRQQRVLRGESIEYKLRITLEDAARGTRMTITVPRMVRCEACSGSGMAPGSSKQSCPTCEGQGQIQYRQQSLLGSFINVRACPDCHGAGEIIEQPCHKCRGSGRMKEKSKISISVPEGVDNGSRLRLKGQGNAGIEGGPSGDLFIVIELIEHPSLVRKGRNIHSTATISYPEASLGTKIDVDTLWGPETLSVQSGKQPGKTFSLKGKGIKNIHRGAGRGDHFVDITVEVPRKLSSKQKKALESYAETLKT